MQKKCTYLNTESIVCFINSTYNPQKRTIKANKTALTQQINYRD